AARALVGIEDLLHEPATLELLERRVQRPERHRPEEPQALAELALQLVAVHRPLLEQAEDGEVQHGGGRLGWSAGVCGACMLGRSRCIAPMYQRDMPTRYNATIHPQRIPPHGVAAGRGVGKAWHL